MTIFYGISTIKKIKPHTDKKFVILKDEYYKNGLVDRMKHNIVEYILEEISGNIPVININKNNTYGELYGENVWDYYFNSVSSYTLDEVYAFQDYTVLSRELFSRAKKEIQEFVRLGVVQNRIEQVKRIE